MFGVISMSRIDRAFNAVRQELCEVGLLEDGLYLDSIECVRAALPTGWFELGYVFDSAVPWHLRVVGFEPGVIYLPINANVDKYTPGGTLRDVVRHEFAHAWAWHQGALQAQWRASTGS